MPALTNPKFISEVDLRRRYGGRSRMWPRRIAERDLSFPRVVLIGGRRFYVLADLEKWERSLVDRA